MQPVDEHALEAAAWQAFVQQLADHLAGQWPAMPERLGERYSAFVELAVQQALQRGWGHSVAIARCVNLAFVWGPAFHEKPGFEWAAGLMAGPVAREWAIAHQLVQRSLAELLRLPGARMEPQALLEADHRLIQRFAGHGRHGAMRLADASPLPRKACDLEAADLRLLDDGWHQEYRLEAGEWQRQRQPWPDALRVDAASPCPPMLSALSRPPGPWQGPATRLQVRVRSHAVCDGDLHPGIGFAGPHGLWTWAGHETRGVNWPLPARPQDPPPAGAATAFAEETSPELCKLQLLTCGLRDEGDALGPQTAVVSVWLAEQWWVQWQRAVPPAQALLPGPRPWQRGSTRCRVERDGQPVPAQPLQRLFEEGLDAAVATALQTLGAGWEAVPGLQQARQEGLMALLTGQMAGTWGWRLGAGGLNGPALMRVVAALDLQAGQVDLEFGGELHKGQARSHVSVRVQGQAPLQQTLVREQATPTVAAVLMPAVARWRWSFTATVDPVANDSAALLMAAGPVSGALVGEAGLRPCTHGRSGWEWYALVRVEPAVLPLSLVDPLLGAENFNLPLWPEQVLLNWSLG